MCQRDDETGRIAANVASRYGETLRKLGIYDDAVQAASEALLRWPRSGIRSAKTVILRMIGEERPIPIEADDATEAFMQAVSCEPTMDDWMDAHKALSVCPPQLREVIFLHFWDGLSFEEIGDEIGVSHSVAYDRYVAGIKAIRDALGYAEH